jgi:hypothetical protein
MYPTVILVLVGVHRSFRDQVFTDGVLAGVGVDAGGSVEGSAGSSAYNVVELTIPVVYANSTLDGAGSAAASVGGKDTVVCERSVRGVVPARVFASLDYNERTQAGSA